MSRLLRDSYKLPAAHNKLLHTVYMVILCCFQATNFSLLFPHGIGTQPSSRINKTCICKPLAEDRYWSFTCNISFQFVDMLWHIEMICGTAVNFCRDGWVWEFCITFTQDIFQIWLLTFCQILHLTFLCSVAVQVLFCNTNLVLIVLPIYKSYKSHISALVFDLQLKKCC